ncbi:MAG: SDR family oxidoreductase [Desulfovibrio sp.]|jgi:UDP-glucose 4-epimerase|nr:SDR family oxidoreductase [Desulfovibrio sp.]
MDMPARKGQCRCLVTGGLGYTGTWISRHLASKGHEVFIFSRNSARIEPDFPCTLIRGDVERLDSEETACRLPEGLDLVVHTAGLTEDSLPDYPRRALRANSLGTRNLLDALLRCSGEHGGQLPLVVYCSTIHVYGRNNGLISEESPAAPMNDYAVTHFFAEEYCRMFMRMYGLPCVILRLSNGYGAPGSPDGAAWRLLLNNLCRSALRDGELRLRSDPSTPRDFVWLGDYCRVIEALMHRRDLAGRIFNVSLGKSLSIGEVAARTAKTVSVVTGREIPLFQGKTEPGRKNFLEISNKALTSALNISFEDRMEDEIRKILRLLQETDS